MTNFIVISENEANLKKKDNPLSTQDIQELLEYRDIFIKFLDKSLFSYQIELCK